MFLYSEYLTETALRIVIIGLQKIRLNVETETEQWIMTSQDKITWFPSFSQDWFHDFLCEQKFHKFTTAVSAKQLMKEAEITTVLNKHTASRLMKLSHNETVEKICQKLQKQNHPSTFKRS